MALRRSPRSASISRMRRCSTCRCRHSTGVEVCCRLQADPLARRPRLVLVSAFLSPEAIIRARACGMDHQLEKTTSRREICDVLAGATPTDPAA